MQTEASKSKRSTKTKAEPKQERQGEVLLVPVAELPKGAKAEKTKGAVMLSRGSSSQHEHTIVAKSYSIGDGAAAQRFVVLAKPATLTCSDAVRHGPIEVAAGTYEVVLHQEFAGDVARTVAD